MPPVSDPEGVAPRPVSPDDLPVNTQTIPAGWNRTPTQAECDDINARAEAERVAREG